MKTKSIPLALALLTITGATAQPDGSREGRRPPPVPPLLEILDVDHDGLLSSAEIQYAPEALEQLDADSDGKITREEMHPPKPNRERRQGPPPGDRPVPPIIVSLDTDHDGSISAAEIGAAPDSLRTLDKNNDGELSPQELHPRAPRPPKDQRGQDGRPPHGPPPEGDPSGS